MLFCKREILAKNRAIAAAQHLVRHALAARHGQQIEQHMSGAVRSGAGAGIVAVPLPSMVARRRCSLTSSTSTWRAPAPAGTRLAGSPAREAPLLR